MQRSSLARYIDPDVLSELSRHSFRPNQLVVGQLAGGHKSPLAGFAVEFAGHREYVPGDDPKHIDWRVYFNRDKYFTKQYELETNCVVYIVLDDSRSMIYGQQHEQKWEFACRLAMTLAQLVVRRRDQVTLSLMRQAQRVLIPPGNTMVQLVHLAEMLHRSQPEGDVDLGGVLIDLAAIARRRSVVFIISDLFGDLGALDQGLRRLRFDRREVILMQVVHADELTLPFGGSVEFAGLEGVESIRTAPSEIRHAYLQALGEYQHNLERTCHRNGCEYLLLRTDGSLAGQLLRYLDRSSRVRRRGGSVVPARLPSRGD